MKYRKKPVIVDAHVWNKNGDHPEDGSLPFHDGSGGLTEGRVVRRYRNPRVFGRDECQKCGMQMHEHGWIDCFGCSHTVCPGDIVVTEEDGTRYPCNPDVFMKMYEPEE